ncbi:MAG: preprotein translocase subunit SecG [Xanthomonadales bacterium]|nr:preprotein translocase subunit SecG [Xanthomonadales bacterium]
MQALNIFYVLIAIAMVALILVQKGAGATAGAAFGSGASGTVFGARGAGNFLTRTTWVLATLFCTISLLMAVLVSRMSNAPETDLGVMGNSPAITESVEVDVADPGLAILDEIDEAQPTIQTETMPSAEEQADAAAPAVLEAVEDLPSIDEGSAPMQIDQAEVDQKDPASGSASDGS